MRKNIVICFSSSPCALALLLFLSLIELAQKRRGNKMLMNFFLMNVQISWERGKERDGSLVIFMSKSKNHPKSTITCIAQHSGVCLYLYGWRDLWRFYAYTQSTLIVGDDWERNSKLFASNVTAVVAKCHVRLYSECPFNGNWILNYASLVSLFADSNNARRRSRYTLRYRRLHVRCRWIERSCAGQANKASGNRPERSHSRRADRC